MMFGNIKILPDIMSGSEKCQMFIIHFLVEEQTLKSNIFI